MGGHLYPSGSIGGLLFLSNRHWNKFVASIWLANNNKDELYAVLMVLKHALHFGVKLIQFIIDSLLMIDWISKKYLRITST